MVQNGEHKCARKCEPIVVVEEKTASEVRHETHLVSFGILDIFYFSKSFTDLLFIITPSSLYYSLNS